MVNNDVSINHIGKSLIKIITKQNNISLIHIRVTDQIYFEKVLTKVKKIVNTNSMTSIGTRFPDPYIYEKQLYRLSFFYQSSKYSTVEIGLGLFSHIISLYKSLKTEISPDEAFIHLTVYSKDKKIIGYKEYQSPQDDGPYHDIENLKKKINIVKDLAIELN